MMGAVLDENAWRLSPGYGASGDNGCCIDPVPEVLELRTPFALGVMPRSR